MSTPALRFREDPYDPNRLNNLLLQFRARGYVVLPDLFERESVDPFLEEVLAMVKPDAGRPTGDLLADPRAAAARGLAGSTAFF